MFKIVVVIDIIFEIGKKNNTSTIQKNRKAWANSGRNLANSGFCLGKSCKSNNKTALCLDVIANTGKKT